MTSTILPADDGKVYDGEELNEAMVEFYPENADSLIWISGGHGHYELDSVSLNAKQALSLLEWLRQQKEVLKEKSEGTSDVS